MKTSIPSRRALAAFAAAGVALTGLTACSSSSSTSTEPPSAAPGCPVTVTDPWVKAADKGMTAAFGTLRNSSSEAADIVSAASPNATSMELHEVVDDNGQMVMQPVPGGFTVPANGDLRMEPGGYHLMLMDLTGPIKSGQQVAFTITCADGASVEFRAQAREFEGGAEDYQNEGMADPGGTDMGSMSPTPTSP